MLTVDAATRPSFESLLECEWLQTTRSGVVGLRSNANKVSLDDTQKRFAKLNEMRQKQWKQKTHAIQAVWRLNLMKDTTAETKESKDDGLIANSTACDAEISCDEHE